MLRKLFSPRRLHPLVNMPLFIYNIMSYHHSNTLYYAQVLLTPKLSSTMAWSSALELLPSTLRVNSLVLRRRMSRLRLTKFSRTSLVFWKTAVPPWRRSSRSMSSSRTWTTSRPSTMSMPPTSLTPSLAVLASRLLAFLWMFLLKSRSSLPNRFHTAP